MIYYRALTVHPLSASCITISLLLCNCFSPYLSSCVRCCLCFYTENDCQFLEVYFAKYVNSFLNNISIAARVNMLLFLTKPLSLALGKSFSLYKYSLCLIFLQNSLTSFSRSGWLKIGVGVSFQPLERNWI